MIMQQHKVIAFRDCLARLKNGHPNHNDQIRELGSKLGSGETDLLPYLVTLAKTVLEHPKLGNSIFLLLFNPECLVPADRINDLRHCIQTLLATDGSLAVTRLICQNHRKKMGLRALSFELERMLSEQMSKRFPPRSIDEICIDFQSKDLKNRLSDAEIACFGRQVKQVFSEESHYRKMTEAELIERLRALKTETGNADLRLPENQQHLIICLGVVRELFGREFRFFPHAIQLMTVLGLLTHRTGLRGYFAEVKTGEGKSCVIAVTAFILGFLGRKVRVGTSSNYLSIREVEKFAGFFGKIGLTTDHVCRDSQSNCQQNVLKNAILYGQPSDFKFIYLIKRLAGESLSLGDDFILDEGDAVFIDRGQESARIADSSDAGESQLLDAIFDFAAQSENLKSISVATLRTRLSQKFSATFVQDLSDLRLKHYLESLQMAMLKDKERESYMVTPKGEIMIVEHAQTGEFREGSRWQKGRHYFLERKHHLIPKPESRTIAALNPAVFFNLFENLYVVSGTGGTAVEREEMAKIYGVESFDVPEYLTCLRREYPRKLCRAEAEYFQEIIHETREMITGGRSVLILVPTIDAARGMLARFQEAQLYPGCIDATNPSETDYLVSSAGAPQKILLGTNITGRGMDIVLQKATIEAGGLHVIFGFFPESLRAFFQGIGRAARQGMPGSYRLIIGPKDRVFSEDLAQNLYSVPNDDTVWMGLEQFRDMREQYQSIQRQEAAMFERKKHEYLERFFDLMSSAGESATTLKSHWSLAYDEMETIETANFEAYCQKIDGIYKRFLDRYGSS